MGAPDGSRQRRFFYPTQAQRAGLSTECGRPRSIENVQATGSTIIRYDAGSDIGGHRPRLLRHFCREPIAESGRAGLENLQMGY